MSQPPNNRRSRRPRRRSLREDHHDAAVAEAQGAETAAVPDHPLVISTPPEMITEAEPLTELLDHIRGAGCFAFDTEFIGEESYVPRLCLMQVATADRLVLIDPIGGLDVTGVWELLADPEIRTLVHAGQQDLEPVVRLLDRAPANIVDTQIAAAFASRPYPLSLRALVECFVGVRLGKSMTFTRWDRRPISKGHCRYAADDVRYLLAVEASLNEEIATAGHADWVQQEFDALNDVTRYRFDADARTTRIMSGRRLERRTIAALRAIVELRDLLARTADIPPRAMLKDDVLIRIAKQMPKSPDELDRLKGVPWPVVQEHGAKIVEAMDEVRNINTDDLPPSPPREESVEDRVAMDTLWALASTICHGAGIDPMMATTRRGIATWYAARNGAMESGGALDSGWRKELLGAPLERCMNGDGGFAFNWRDGRLHGGAGA